MWFGLIIVLVLILVVWWLLTHNAKLSQEEMPSHAAEEMPPHAEVGEHAEAVKAAPEAATIKEDDLTLIEGIGPKIDRILKQAGILTFAQLSAKDPNEIKRLLLEAGLRLGDPSTWPEQARLAAAGDSDGLMKLQESLKAGRVVNE